MCTSSDTSLAHKCPWVKGIESATSVCWEKVFADVGLETFVSPHRESQHTLSSYLFMEIKSDMSMYV